MTPPPTTYLATYNSRLLPSYSASHCGLFALQVVAMSPSPFTISVPDAALDKLKQKLADAILPDELADAETWAYGAPLADVKRLANYWRDGYDWRKAEASLNQLPNFSTTVMVERFGLINIHFVHQRSPVEGAIPLLFAHGCRRPLNVSDIHCD